MLNVDKFFVKALSEDADVVEVTDGRIFDPDRGTEDDAEDKIPYLIVNYEGGQSSLTSKDALLAGLDSATVSILCVAADRDALADLTEQVETAIANAFQDEDFYDDGWAFHITGAEESAGPVYADYLKPCCYQTITYQCDTEER